MTYNNFSKLNPNAKIFEELEKEPAWWTLLKEDEDLYIDIRKDKCISVYYNNQLITPITFTKDFNASIHKKYVDGRFFNKSPYTDLDLKCLNKEILAEIKTRIDEQSPATKAKATPASEQELVSQLLQNNVEYIDSNFGYSKDPEMGKIKLNLTDLSEGILSIVEVKDINNKSLYSKGNEVVERMVKLTAFIKKYEEELTIHYRKLIETKQKLGLLILNDDDFTLNMKPQLLIVNTYLRNTQIRKDKTEALKKSLTEHEINFEIY